MVERKYSLQEIDDMRNSVSVLIIAPSFHNGYSQYNYDGHDKKVEERLRTYMLAGIDPEELKAATLKADQGASGG